MLKPENPIVADMTEPMDSAHGIWPEGEPRTGQPHFRPVVPLVGTAAEEVPLPRWPRYRVKDLDDLEDRIEHRVKAVVNALLEEYVDSVWARRLLRAGWWLKRDKVVDRVMKAIEDDLGSRGQLKRLG